jgi:hypothetical protein
MAFFHLALETCKGSIRPLKPGISPEVKEALEAVAKNGKYIVGEANDTNEVGAMGDFCGHW